MSKARKTARQKRKKQQDGKKKAKKIMEPGLAEVNLDTKVSTTDVIKKVDDNDNGGNGRIFVEIASYRDLELGVTIESMLEHADHPEKLTFGIVHQYGPETLHILDSYRGKKEFRIVEMDWRDCRGVGIVRAINEMLYRGEEWVLQIDSHMRFGKGWDTLLKEQWHWCKDEKAVLSTYPALYKYDESGELAFDSTFGPDHRMVLLRPKKSMMTHDTGILRVTAEEKKNHQMMKTYYVAAGLEFFKGSLLDEVHYVKEVAFVGEEITRAIQLYTHGYNIYIPMAMPIFHHYLREKVHLYWQDMSEDPELKKIYDDSFAESERVIIGMLSAQDRRYYGTARRAEDFINMLGDLGCIWRIEDDTPRITVPS